MTDITKVVLVFSINKISQGRNQSVGKNIYLRKPGFIKPDKNSPKLTLWRAVLAVAEEASVTEVDHKVTDHKVTVTIQKPMTIEQDIGGQSQPPSISVSGVSATAQSISQQAPPRESHVTVIKVQEETIKETKGKIVF